MLIKTRIILLNLRKEIELILFSQNLDVKGNIKLVYSKKIVIRSSLLYLKKI